MKLLSIDIGIRNLSYCYIDIDAKNILEWQTLCIIESEENANKKKIDELVVAMLETLNDKFDHEFEADFVIIENQPMLLNGLMKTLSVVVYTYFQMLSMHFGNVKKTSFISATNKLKCKKASNIDKKTYKDRKKASIKIAETYLESMWPEKLEWFSTLKKKDDYSDTLCQAIYYIESVLKNDI